MFELLKPEHISKFITLLSQLSPQSSASLKNYYELTSKKEIWVYWDGDLVGTVSLLFEHKANRPNGICCHIEDVVVDKEYRGKGIGEKLVRFAIDRAELFGCYKTILDCSEHMIPFYEKCGFKVDGVMMRH